MGAIPRSQILDPSPLQSDHGAGSDHRRLAHILDDLELTGYFATITVSSSLEGVEKPNPEIFRRTLVSLGVAPHQALHVGDSPRDDCQATAEAGLQAVLIDRHGLFPGEPWRRIASLTDLLDLVL